MVFPAQNLGDENRMLVLPAIVEMHGGPKGVELKLRLWMASRILVPSSDLASLMACAAASRAA